MPEVQDLVGVIETDVELDRILSAEAATERRDPSRLGPPAPPASIERLTADLPRLTGELRQELERFLAQAARYDARYAAIERPGDCD